MARPSIALFLATSSVTAGLTAATAIGGLAVGLSGCQGTSPGGTDQKAKPALPAAAPAAAPAKQEEGGEGGEGGEG